MFWGELYLDLLLYGANFTGRFNRETNKSSKAVHKAALKAHKNSSTQF
jgi:hypothetical protein